MIATTVVVVFLPGKCHHGLMSCCYGMHVLLVQRVWVQGIIYLSHIFLNLAFVEALVQLLYLLRIIYTVSVVLKFPLEFRSLYFLRLEQFERILKYHKYGVISKSLIAQAFM